MANHKRSVRAPWLALVLASMACTTSSPVPQAWNSRTFACGDDEAEVTHIVHGSESAAILTLRTRTHDVRVYSRDDGLRFTVAHRSGDVLATEVTEDRFSERFPELHRNFEDAFAGEGLWAGTESRVIDAGL